VPCGAQLAQGDHFSHKIHGSGFLQMLSSKFIFGNTFNVTKDRAAQARHFEPSADVAAAGSLLLAASAASHWCCGVCWCTCVELPAVTPVSSSSHCGH